MNKITNLTVGNQEIFGIYVTYKRTFLFCTIRIQTNYTYLYNDTTFKLARNILLLLTLPVQILLSKGSFCHT